MMFRFSLLLLALLLGTSAHAQSTCNAPNIDFSDNGVGMTAPVQARVLEPFFTTKDVGDGTGLGLSISYGIILQHDGKLQIDSTPAQGSCFTVILPVLGNG